MNEYYLHDAAICMTVFLVVAISLLFRKGEEGRKEGRMGGRKNLTFEYYSSYSTIKKKYIYIYILV